MQDVESRVRPIDAKHIVDVEEDYWTIPNRGWRGMGGFRISHGQAEHTADMAAIGGKHTQAGTNRVLTYWATFGPTERTMLFYAAVISEGINSLGQHEATLRFDPAGIPAEAVVRMHLRKYLDQTSFGKGKTRKESRCSRERQLP